MSAAAAISKKQPRGKPFQKGQTGNPSGRPKRTQEEYDLIEACKLKCPQALDTVMEIMTGGENERNRLAAAQYVIDRAYGKAQQTTEITGKNGTPLFERVEIVVVHPKG